MSEEKNKTITASELKAYLDSLEQEKEQEKINRIQEYTKANKEIKEKAKEKEILKIEKALDKEYNTKELAQKEILKLLENLKQIPEDLARLKIMEYMIYRVDLRRAEKKINKVAKEIKKIQEETIKDIEEKLDEFPYLDDVNEIDYSEYEIGEDALAKTKEQYKLEFTEEERNELIKRELEIAEKVKYFNSIPIPHEILKNSDRDIQSKMQKFNRVRQKKIRILSSIEQDYKKLMDPREINSMIDDAIASLDLVKEILTESEYNSVKKLLIKRRKKIFRSTNEIRSIIASKEKRTGILNFNIQEARYKRMEFLGNEIQEATTLIDQNPITSSEEQLEKLKIAYEREKQYASVIEKLNDKESENYDAELETYKSQIKEIKTKVNKSKKIIAEQQERINKAKKELLILWKMEIDATISRKKETLELPEGTFGEETEERENIPTKNIFTKLKKISSGKHACT